MEADLDEGGRQVVGVRVRWLHPVLAVVVELEAGQVRRVALPAESD
ncbi:hypothetical protein [Kitasatospora sp. NPDC054795]